MIETKEAFAWSALPVFPWERRGHLTSQLKKCHMITISTRQTQLEIPHIESPGPYLSFIECPRKAAMLWREVVTSRFESDTWLVICERQLILHLGVIEHCSSSSIGSDEVIKLLISVSYMAECRTKGWKSSFSEESWTWHLVHVILCDNDHFSTIYKLIPALMQLDLRSIGT